MDAFVDSSRPPKVGQKEINNLHRPTARKEIETIVKQGNI